MNKIKVMESMSKAIYVGVIFEIMFLRLSCYQIYGVVEVVPVKNSRLDLISGLIKTPGKL